MTKVRSMLLVAALAVPAAALAQAGSITPGEWDMAITTDSIMMPGMDASMSKAMAGRTTHIRHCITPADAARGPQDMLKGSKECTFSHYSMIGGRLHSETTCKQPGGTMTAVGDGTFTPTGFTMKSKSTMTGDSAMTITATMVGKRVGACPAK